MRVYLRRYVAAALTALMVAGCSGSGGNPVAPIQGGAVPTATPTAVGATATPTPVSATATPTGVTPTTTPSSGATATPTPGSGGTATPTAVPTPTIKPSTAPTPTAKPTATPVPTATPSAGAPTPLPSGTGVGDTTCSVANEPVPGIYTSILTTGSVSGSTFTGSSGGEGESSWSADYYTTPSPTPLPTATVTPIATPTPISTPTPVPTVTPTPNMYTLYNGTYFVPGYTGKESADDSNGQPYTASQTTGCFTLILQQAVGGTAGQIVRRQATSAPSNLAIGFGDPGFLNATQETNVDGGELQSITITDLTPTSGNGTFTFIPTGGTTVHGTATITGSETFVFSGSRRVQDALHKYYMLYRSAQWYGRHLHRR